MSAEYQSYTPRNFGAAGPSSDGGVAKEYNQKKFETHPKQQVAKIAEQQEAHFHLDKNVSSQMGIEAKQKEEFEARLQKEIDRRWQITKEKAEVEGFTKGLEDGKKEAFQAEKPRIDEKLARLETFLQDCDKMREKIFTANETFLMGIIAQVARMVVLKEVELDKDYLHRVVVSLLNQLGTREDIKIFVSEQDAATIDLLKAAVEKEFGKLSNTVFEPSSQILPGGCKIETRFGVVDAAVQTQIENVMRSLSA